MSKKNNPPKSAHPAPQVQLPARLAPAGTAVPPPLSGLMELRDALVAFKGPLADDPDYRRVIEGLLFNNEIHERILGKQVRESAGHWLLNPRGNLDRRLEIHAQGLGESLDQGTARRVVAQDQVE
ncbi:hypothetical protein [Pseudomonas gingeri]|uniref:Uncharacterized protein n=1 Tax=Pseudomonas gingeri TaxID=117681 RepID=A0A7Y7YAF8_9PSED|nr:hypothetical protein [Pseudomonas gingeri]NWB26634.1 hypothetical protein [Pseudomonas gingeri]NWC32816.1 hypothetical protein [Pseudomonas gingeri]NWD07010.1 hypothetical protein [Pseudomonas gingeri]NWE31609.1 hypothetical protein [Pseudomonas gingeri]NWE57374.1 hypothetical protein [Pseudomonas gingeri]